MLVAPQSPVVSCYEDAPASHQGGGVISLAWNGEREASETETIPKVTPPEVIRMRYKRVLLAAA